MVKAKNLSTFAYLKPSVHYFLKQMISKYFVRASILLISIMLLSSCLNNNRNEDVNLSKDAQIYSISLSSKADTARAFSNSPLTIDQIGNRIFNKNPLPYLFSVDSVKINLRGYSTYIQPHSQITIYLKDTDSSYVWNGNDSVAIKRLKGIATTAADGKTTKTYDFQLNIYQEDPDVLNWERLKTDYLISLPVEAQKTILFAGRFFTYYKSGASIKAVSGTDGVNWAVAPVTGLPGTLKFSSLLATNNAVYAIDETNAVYKTTNGVNWSTLTTAYPVVAIYGKLPSATSGNILAIINDGGVNTFAETNDFSSFKLMDAAHAEIPVTDFSVTQINNPKVYSAKYILLSGGLTANGNANNHIWLIQEKGENITTISKYMNFTLLGSTVFNYNNNQYLITTGNGKNTLLFSEDYGLTWKTAGLNQAFPIDFTYRTNASVITDSDNYIWIFGGTSGTSTQLVDVWRGRLNILSN